MAVTSVLRCAMAVAVPVIVTPLAAESATCRAGDTCETKTLARDDVLLQARQTLLKQGQQQASGDLTTITVMSYNTEYKDYNARMAGYANKIAEVQPAIVGLQECQNRDGLAGLAHYWANQKTGRQNYMLFNPNMVQQIDGGSLRIPRDLYAERAITWGKYRLGSRDIFFFNTHLPHNHGEAASKLTHAKIARMFFKLRRHLGAENAPTVVVGDMNSFASDWNHVAGGGFESNLQSHGFANAYTAHGNPGYSGLDHILYSTAHWTASNCRDRGTGGSDHSAITCDMTLI